MEKYIKSHTKLFCDALSENRIPDTEDCARAYARRLKEMYSSEDFRSFNIYPTIDTYKVFAVIAMCLELSEYGFSDDEIIDFINKVFRRLKRLFGALEKIIDSLPCCYAVAKRWNLSDHASRVKDGSITYDTFTVEDSRIEYRISKCMYVCGNVCSLRHPPPVQGFLHKRRASLFQSYTAYQIHPPFRPFRRRLLPR